MLHVVVAYKADQKPNVLTKDMFMGCGYTVFTSYIYIYKLMWNGHTHMLQPTKFDT